MKELRDLVFSVVAAAAAWGVYALSGSGLAALAFLAVFVCAYLYLVRRGDRVRSGEGGDG